MGDGNLIAGGAAETPVRTDIDSQQSRAKTLEIMFMHAAGAYKAATASESTYQGWPEVLPAAYKNAYKAKYPLSGDIIRAPLPAQRSRTGIRLNGLNFVSNSMRRS
ncbi:hypothetical protein H106_04832 [Trichophyton rubrum CBS 735.88]|nr:hypothetical protein H106_04832 [Trichophyton rubrum CBS 735.88]